MTTSGAALLRTLGGATLAIATGRLVLVLLWILAVSLLQLAITGSRLWRAIGRADGGERSGRSAWRTVAAMGLMGVFLMMYLRADTVMIGWLLGEREAGLYTAA